MPEDIINEPLVFAAGGDTRPVAWTFQPNYTEDHVSMEEVSKMALQYEVDFIVWAGDLAYADGLEENLYHWDMRFEANMNTLITDDGRH
ncbi:MAG: hypothetical protein WD267_05070 [Balneolales bacterium]